MGCATLLGLLAATAQAEPPPWASGIGALACTRLADIPPAALLTWAQGYWSGLNHAHSVITPCASRRDLSTLTANQAATLLEIHCAALADGVIMEAANNALVGLPIMDSPPTAACGGS